MPVLNHMDMLNNQDLEILLAERAGPCISLYMPTERMGMEVQQNPIRLKNLLTQAEEQLRTTEIQPSDQRDLLAPLQQMQDDYDFWQRQSDGLALFAAPNFFAGYRVPLKLDELVTVGDQFHIRLLLPLLSRDQRFFILALSLNQIQLFQATRYSLHEITLNDMATSMDEALRLDDPEKQAQFHTSTSSPGNAGTRAAIFHGHAPDEDHKGDILRFFRQVDTGVTALLRDEQVPLVLVGVDYLHPLYHEANTYPHLAEHGVEGNPAELGAMTFHTQSWDIVKSRLDAARNDAISQYRALAAQNIRASDDVKTVLPAAAYGRVDILFLARGIQLWGDFDPQAGTTRLYAEAGPANVDLLDMAAAETIKNGGSVYVVEPADMPGETPVSGIFRY